MIHPASASVLRRSTDDAGPGMDSARGARNEAGGAGRPDLTRRTVVRALVAAAAGAALPLPLAAASPVLLGLDAEFGLAHSTSAQAIELGMRVAIDEINRAGGVLGGRPLQLVTRDHRSIPARGVRNLEQLAALPDLVAVFGGRFSPVVIEQLPLIAKLRLPFMAVWSSADMITDNGMQPNYVFRLSLRDSIAMPKLLSSASARGLAPVGMLLTNTSWGRSNLAAAEQHVRQGGKPAIAAVAWFNAADRSFIEKYLGLVDSGARAVILVGNDEEGATLVREVAGLPRQRRVPIISHWGITGGEFFTQAGAALREVDLSVIQTFSFFRADPGAVQRFLRTAAQVSEGRVRRIENIDAPVGAAHAYDATHIVARAVEQAGSTRREAVRDALERLGSYDGLIKRYSPPFTPTRHDALGPAELLMTRYREDGILVPVEQ